MHWPWERSRLETRDDAGTYTEAVLQQILTGVTGGEVSSSSAAVEAAAGLWARGFASAKVMPATRSSASLTPGVLSHIGRQLLQRGQAVFELSTVRGRLELHPASTWTVTGSTDPETWVWALTIPGPSLTATRHLPADRVLNLTYSHPPGRPWEGRGPLANAHTSLQLLDRIETRLAEEMGGPVGGVLAVPNVGTSAQLQADLQKLKGELVLVEGTTGGWGDPSQAPSQRHPDYQVRRIGANPPDSLRALRSDVSMAILAAAGCPSSLLGPSDGTLARESWRQFLYSTLQPIGLVIGETLAASLDVEGLAFDWSELGASDISGRARAFQSLVGGGMTVEKAAALAGLMVNDE